MSSPAQAAANLANAQHSTGPRTDAGKAAASQNALKHGLTASTVLIPGEDPAEFAQFEQSLFDFWRPFDTGEEVMVQELIYVQWRLKRCVRLEAAIFSAETPDFKALNNISLHEARLKRQYSATLKELDILQKARWLRELEKFQQAEIIRRADIAAGRATNLAEFGFDFTLEKVDQHIRRQNHIEAATRALAKAASAAYPGPRRAA